MFTLNLCLCEGSGWNSGGESGGGYHDGSDGDHLPAVWMPRLSELNNAGRNDLAQAITRYGGNKVICKKAGLVPYREWKYLGQADSSSSTVPAQFERWSIFLTLWEQALMEGK